MSEEGLGGVESDVPESFVVHAAAEELGDDGEDEGGGDDDRQGSGGCGLVAGSYERKHSGHYDDDGE